MHEITMQDIHGYLATKQDEEVIGHCMNASACLAHNTLTWKYQLEDTGVEALCSYAFVTGAGMVDFPRDVEEAVRIFDTLKTSDSPVTKAEFVAAMEGNAIGH